MHERSFRVHCFQHVSYEGPGFIAGWAAARAFPIAYTRFYEGEPLPDMDSFDCLLIMGGPMGVGDEARFPWLRQEKRFIREALTQGKPVIGICLGAQLIAEALGAKVYPNSRKEIGWFPVRFSPEALREPLLEGFPTEMQVFHWHGDTFDIPPEARLLCGSAACRNQAFLHGDRVLALQFHFECTETSLERMLEEGKDEIREARSRGETAVQSPEEIRSGKGSIPPANAGLEILLDRIAAIGNTDR